MRIGERKPFNELAVAVAGIGGNLIHQLLCHFERALRAFSRKATRTLVTAQAATFFSHQPHALATGPHR
jgi:hypothetical protein